MSEDSSGIFPICPLPLSRPIKSAYEEQSRKGLRHNLDLSRKKWVTPDLETPRFSLTPKRMSGTSTCIPRLLLEVLWLEKQRRRLQNPHVPGLAWKSQTFFYQTLATSLKTQLGISFGNRLLIVLPCRARKQPNDCQIDASNDAFRGGYEGDVNEVVSLCHWTFVSTQMFRLMSWSQAPKLVVGYPP